MKTADIVKLLGRTHVSFGVGCGRVLAVAPANVLGLGKLKTHWTLRRSCF